MSANFMPTIGPYSNLKPFRFWCQQVLPLTYDDSLSYYELLNKVVDYLNKTMEDVDTVTNDMQAMLAAFDSLQSYVNTYFDNLDITANVEIALDKMAENGSLSALLSPIVGEQIGGVVADQIDNAVAQQIYNTVAEQIGSVVALQLSSVVPNAVGTWLEENVDPESDVIIDKSLAINGAAAESAMTGAKFNMLNAYLNANNGLKSLEKTCIVSSSGKWATPTAKHVSIPVNAGDVVTLTSGESQTTYSFIKLDNATNGENVSFADGYSSRTVLAANTTVELTIPETCFYLCISSYSPSPTPTNQFPVYVNINGVNYTRNVVPYIQNIDSRVTVLETDNDNNKEDIENINDVINAPNGIEYWNENGVIYADGQYRSDASKHINIKVETSDVITLRYGTSIGVYAFLKSTGSVGEMADFCEGYTSRIVTQAFTDYNLTLPADCKYLYIATRNANNDYIGPTNIIINGTDRIYNIRQKLDELSNKGERHIIMSENLNTKLVIDRDTVIDGNGYAIDLGTHFDVNDLTFTSNKATINYTANETDFMYTTFITGADPFIGTRGQYQFYNCCLYAIYSDKSKTTILTPASSATVLNNTNNSFRYTVSSDVGTITVHINDTDGLIDIVLCNDKKSGYTTNYCLLCDGHNITVKNTKFLFAASSCVCLMNSNYLFENCEFAYSKSFCGFESKQSNNGRVVNCLAHNVAGDGYNYHSGGSHEIVSSDAYYCGDDGVSHHDEGTVFNILGGEYHHNGKAGVASPAQRCYGEIHDVYVHDNIYGILLPYPYVTSSQHYGDKIKIYNPIIISNTTGIRSGFKCVVKAPYFSGNTTDTDATDDGDGFGNGQITIV